MVFIRCSFLQDLNSLDFNDEQQSVDVIRDHLSAYSGIPANFLVLIYNGKYASSDQRIPNDSSIDVCLTLPGGKGGFGSMLRAIGAQIEKTTNREACRDLSGRRLRDINEEQRLKRWLAKKAEREAEQLRRRKEKLERLKEMPRHEFHDPEYNKQRSELPERIDAALSEGLKKKTSSGDKRPASSLKNNGEPRVKKECLWLGDDVSLDSEESDQDATLSSEENSRSSQKHSSDSKDEPKSPVQELSDASTSSQEIQMELQNKCPQQETVDSSQPETYLQEVQVESQSENNQNEELNNSSLNNGINKITESEKEPAKKKEIDSSSVDQLPSLPSEPKAVEEECTLDLLAFKSSSELESLGLEKLKAVLTSMGLKCGGTLAERAQRVWSVRGMDPKDYPRALKAKPKKG